MRAPRSLVDKQLAAFRQNFAGVNLAYAETQEPDPYDVLTIASMVEREARVARERPLVAAVIYNRLHAAAAARDRRDDPLRDRATGPSR